MYIRKIRNPTLLKACKVRTRAHDAPVFDVPFPTCEAYKRSIRYSGAVAWNDLSVELRNENMYIVFKWKQKKQMLLPLKNV